MLIYAEKITPRLCYITEVFFGEVRFTSSITEFFDASIPKINYSSKRFGEAEFHIAPSGLLYEETIRRQDTACFDWNGLKVFFKTKGDLPFDLFSAAFYLLSRYEEYLPHKKDAYGRYSHEESLAYKENFLQVPLVNLWMQEFYSMIEQRFPGYAIPVSDFSFLPTYDIDIAYATKGKGIFRRLAAMFRKQSTINGKDAFDVYDWLHELHHNYQLSPLYFFLLAKHRSKYDKNISPGSSALKRLAQTISAKYLTGVHPSWQSHFDEQMVSAEKKRLEKIIRKPVKSSRQHYIKFTLPDTFRSLVNAGITDDYSMGYGSINGFRASYASSYYWYDLMRERTTPLLLHPFCYMDANSYFEQHYSPKQAAQELQQYHEMVKQVGGQLITVFHNHFLTEQDEWIEWRKMYQAFLQRNFS